MASIWHRSLLNYSSVHADRKHASGLRSEGREGWIVSNQKKSSKNYEKHFLNDRERTHETRGGGIIVRGIFIFNKFGWRLELRRREERPRRDEGEKEENRLQCRSANDSVATRQESKMYASEHSRHYETDIMTSRGFHNRIPRKRYEAWSARYLGFDIEIKYAFSRESYAIATQRRNSNYSHGPADRPTYTRCVSYYYFKRSGEILRIVMKITARNNTFSFFFFLFPFFFTIFETTRYITYYRDSAFVFFHGTFIISIVSRFVYIYFHNAEGKNVVC